MNNARLTSFDMAYTTKAAKLGIIFQPSGGNHEQGSGQQEDGKEATRKNTERKERGKAP
jgi:hypothetical protein